jgi:uncharacterized membrane protein
MNDAPAGPPAASDTGMAPNLAGTLVYLLMPLTGIIFYVVEKRNAFIRFHAAQSIVVGAASFVLWVAVLVLGTILSVVPLLGALVSMLLSLAVGLALFGLWLFLMFQAFSGNEWEVPVLGGYARKLLESPSPQI